MPKGEMTAPVWMPLTPLSASHDVFSSPKMFVKVAVGFMGRQSDMLRLNFEHKFGSQTFLGHAGEEAPAFRYDALVHTGARATRLDLAAGGDLSLQIDDHDPAIRVGILEVAQDATKRDDLNPMLLGEFVVTPCSESGAAMKVVEPEDDSFVIAEIEVTGHHLAARDASLMHGRSSDPYLQITQDGAAIAQTEVVVNDLNPVWKAIIVRLAVKGKVRVVCMDHDMLTRDDLIGEAEVSVKELLTTGRRINLRCNEKGAGQLRVREAKIKRRSGMTADWDRTKIAALYGARAREAQRECQVLFSSWLRRHSVDEKEGRLRIRDLQSVLVEHGVPDKDVNELLMVLDSEASEKGTVTLREFERFGLRYLNAAVGKFQDLLGRVDLDAGAAYPRADLMVVALQADEALSSAKKPTLRDALAFYRQRVCPSCCLLVTSCYMCSARGGRAREHDVRTGEECGVDQKEGPESQAVHVAGTDFGGVNKKMKARRRCWQCCSCFRQV